MKPPKIILSLAMPLGHWSPHLKAALASVVKVNAQCQHGQIALSILDASQDERVRADIKASGVKPAYMRSGPDGGQTAAISEGWAHVEGDIVGWLNGDDAIVYGALDEVFKHFQQTPNTDVVCGQSVISDEHGRIIGLHPEVVPVSSLLLRSNIISQPSCFVRREALEAVDGLNDCLEYTMDWDFWVRLYKAGKNFHYINQVFSNVVWDFETKTSKFNWQRTKELLSIVGQSNNVYGSAKSLFGFFQHYIKTYKKPVKQNMPLASLKTPISPTLALPVLNLTIAPQTFLNVYLQGTLSQSKPCVHLMVDGETKKLTPSNNCIEITPPVELGDYILLEFESSAEQKIYFDGAHWGQGCTKYL